MEGMVRVLICHHAPWPRHVLHGAPATGGSSECYGVQFVPAGSPAGPAAFPGEAL